MTYRLTLNAPEKAKSKDLGENVFLNNLPQDYKVYLFYYPGAMANETLEDNLRRLGDITGKNLFVNIAKLNDPNYSKIVNYFKINELPVIVMTAVSELSSNEDTSVSAFVRIDNKNLLNSNDRIIIYLQNLYNLFLGGNISEALKKAKRTEIETYVRSFTEIISNALGKILKFFDERDISISLAEGKFELKRN
jgi:hypothetical protein